MRNNRAALMSIIEAAADQHKQAAAAEPPSKRRSRLFSSFSRRAPTVTSTVTSGSATPDVEDEHANIFEAVETMYAASKRPNGSADIEPWFPMPASSRASSAASLTSVPTNDARKPGTRTVEDLRPRRALTIGHSATVADAACAMAEAREDAILVVAEGTGKLQGILTDSDVARKVLAHGLDPARELVGGVMTSAPTCVLTSDDALEALSLMMERRFRHLPVLRQPEDGGTEARVAGVLDVARCMHDAISWLEVATKRGEFSQLRVTLDKVLERSSASHLRASGSPPVAVAVDAAASVQEAAGLMAARRGAVLVSSEGRPCVGIITPKDLLFKVVAVGLDGATTKVEQIMTPNPDTMLGSCTAVQALLSMQRGKYRNVPVVSDGGEPLGVLDVLALLDGALSIGHEVSDGAAEAALTFKVAYKGLTLRVQAGADDLAAEVHARLVAARGDAVPPLAHMRLSFLDNDGDVVSLACAADARDAISWAKKAGKDVLPLQASFPADESRLRLPTAPLALLSLTFAVGGLLLLGARANPRLYDAVWKKGAPILQPMVDLCSRPSPPRS